MRDSGNCSKGIDEQGKKCGDIAQARRQETSRPCSATNLGVPGHPGDCRRDRGKPCLSLPGLAN